MAVLLAIDIGNTRLKWGMHDGHRWLIRTASATGQLPNPSGVDRTIFSNVVDQQLDADIVQRFPQAHKICALPQQCGVRNGYRDPATLGSDRWAALIGAQALGARTAVIASAGTALTVDALHDGQFLGGSIGPGLDALRQALAARTGLSAAESSGIADFPVDTSSAVRSGCLAALVGPVERMRERLACHSGRETEVWLCGGNATEIAGQLAGRIEEYLVLEGLARIAQEIWP